MAARSDSFRGDGLNFPAFFPAGSTPLLTAPSAIRLNTVYVVAGAIATVIDVQVGGVSVMASASPIGPNVGIAGRQAFAFSNVVIAAGVDFQFTSTDASARISADFTRV